MSFPITLAFVPQGHFTQPYLALPCLKAWLQEAGFEDVEQRDLSIEAYDHFLSPGYLRRAQERVRERLPLSAFEGRENLPLGELRAFRSAAESEVSANAVIADVEAAKAVLRSEDFYDVDRYVPAVRTLYHGLRLVSAAHYPSELTPHNFTMGYANDRSEEVLAATLDEDQNPFIEFYREEVLPGLIARKPRLLGLSVVYGSQLIPALTLGRMVKAALPDCHVTAGGGFLAYIGEKLMGAAGVEGCLDSMIFHEGEAPMAELAAALEAWDGPEQANLSAIGSLTWFKHSDTGCETVANAPAHPVALNEAPPPDFDGLPFDLYLAPEVVLPYDINRGCYYGECSFCTLPTVIGPGYRTRAAETIAGHLTDLRDRHGVQNFSFITDCMPPGMIRDLPEALIEAQPDIPAEARMKWWCDARIEPRAYTKKAAIRLHESGCRKLLFGFESATPRLLKLMRKAQSPRSVSEVARNCSEAGISVTLYAMVGFPSETVEEARATLNFIREHKDVVREVSLQTFHIDEVALTYRDPEQFNIKILDGAGTDLQLYHDYLSEQGMTQQEAAEMFDEMMNALRADLPIFSGDNIYYFMQKSHYFLHLARGTTPDEFVAQCQQRTEAKTAREAGGPLRTNTARSSVALPFSHVAAANTLAHPLARAARPDFLTGRFVADAQAVAEEQLEPLTPQDCVLVYDEVGHEFVELSRDGLKVLEAIERAGNVDNLLQSLKSTTPGARERLTNYIAQLHNKGLITTFQPAPALPSPSTEPHELTSR